MFVQQSNHWPIALALVLSAFQLQSHFHRAFLKSTALHGISDKLFQWRFGSYSFRSQRYRCSYSVERFVWHTNIHTFYVLLLNPLSQILDRATALLQSGISTPVGLTEGPLALCAVARCLVFGLSSLVRRLLASECSSSARWACLSWSNFVPRTLHCIDSSFSTFK